MRQGRVEVGVAEQPLGIDLVVLAHRDVSVLGHWSTIVPSCKKSKYGKFWRIAGLVIGTKEYTTLTLWYI